MASQNPSKDREKVVSKLPSSLRQELKVRAAQLGVDMQDAVTDGIEAWLQTEDPLPKVDTSGGSPFSTHLPSALHGTFQAGCSDRGLPFAQGVAQAIRLWLDTHTIVARRLRAIARRLLFANQKGGVGKTSLSAGVAQALAEMGFRVCIVDYDPQCHLTRELAIEPIKLGEPSLAGHMLGEVRGADLRDLLQPVSPEYFGGRLFLLPGCKDGFLLDAKLVTSRHARVKETALEKAMAPLEADFDFIIIDCPPSLGYAMDNALYYGRTREDEEPDASGVFIPVQAEDSSADAYDMLTEQIDDLMDDLGIEITELGFVVNLYDSRKGYIAVSSLENWKKIENPPVMGVVPDLKEQREARRLHRPLLEYEPTCEQASVMREIARRIAA
jgi:chromosome partitioning protein